MGRRKMPGFWETAGRFLEHHLAEIRQVSPHTVEAYRASLNQYVDYLESQRGVRRRDVSFGHFGAEELSGFLEWMVARSLAPRTCNLRLAAVRSLLEYAAYDDPRLMPAYMAACGIDNVKVTRGPIEYFEPRQLEALLASPGKRRGSDRRNKAMLVFLYETAARVQEARMAKVSDLRLGSGTPYVTLRGKGGKYRNVPLTEKALAHLQAHLAEFHAPSPDPTTPLFYSEIHGQKHALSSDTFEKMIKRYSAGCEDRGVPMPPRPHCHMLRKTRAIDLYRVGMPLPHIQQLLGHESMSTTSGFYAFAMLDAIAEEMEKANADAGEKAWVDPEIADKLLRL